VLAVLLYEELSPAGMALAREVFPRHREKVVEFTEAGEAISVATFADPGRDGAMGIFRNREAAERFVAVDPFILEGVITRWRIIDWNGELD